MPNNWSTGRSAFKSLKVYFQRVLRAREIASFDGSRFVQIKSNIKVQENCWKEMTPKYPKWFFLEWRTKLLCVYFKMGMNTFYSQEKIGFFVFFLSWLRIFRAELLEKVPLRNKKTKLHLKTRDFNKIMFKIFVQRESWSVEWVVDRDISTQWTTFDREVNERNTTHMDRVCRTMLRWQYIPFIE